MARCEVVTNHLCIIINVLDILLHTRWQRYKKLQIWQALPCGKIVTAAVRVAIYALNRLHCADFEVDWPQATKQTNSLLCMQLIIRTFAPPYGRKQHPPTLLSFPLRSAHFPRCFDGRGFLCRTACCFMPHGILPSAPANPCETRSNCTVKPYGAEPYAVRHRFPRCTASTHRPHSLNPWGVPAPRKRSLRPRKAVAEGIQRNGRTQRPPLPRLHSPLSTMQ